jgi:hypothetical protein
MPGIESFFPQKCAQLDQFGARVGLAQVVQLVLRRKPEARTTGRHLGIRVRVRPGGTGRRSTVEDPPLRAASRRSSRLHSGSSTVAWLKNRRFIKLITIRLLPRPYIRIVGELGVSPILAERGRLTRAGVDSDVVALSDAVFLQGSICDFYSALAAISFVRRATATDLDFRR